MIGNQFSEKFEDTKGIIRSRKSKDRQYKTLHRKPWLVLYSIKLLKKANGSQRTTIYIYQNTYNHKSRVTMLSNTEFAE